MYFIETLFIGSVYPECLCKTEVSVLQLIQLIQAGVTINTTGQIFYRQKVLHNQLMKSLF